MVDRLRWKPVFRAYKCGSSEEVLCLILWSQDGWSSFQLALHLITFIDILDHCQPIEPHMVCYSIFFSITLLIISTLELGPFVVQLCFTRKVSRVWTCRLIFPLLAIITLPPCLLHSIIFTFSSQSWLLSLVAIFHISFTWNDNSSHLGAKRAVISLISFHHSALIQRFQLKRLSHGIGFHMFINELREFIHSLQFLIRV